MYSEKILNEFYNPQNYGVIKGAHGVGKVVSDIGSEIIKIYISVENKKIVDSQFQAFGGVVAIACASMVTTFMRDKNIDAILKLTVNDILEIVGEVPENKKYIVQAVTNAMRGAVEDYLNG